MDVYVIQVGRDADPTVHYAPLGVPADEVPSLLVGRVRALTGWDGLIVVHRCRIQPFPAEVIEV